MPYDVTMVLNFTCLSLSKIDALKFEGTPFGFVFLNYNF